MNLTIDFGNSRTKLALFSKGDMVDQIIFDSLNVSSLEEFIQEQNEIKNAIYVAVSELGGDLEKYLNKNFKTIHFSKETAVPIANNYKSPDTLGIDRLATAIGAQAEYPNKNLLIIDAGTAITYDFVDKKESFMAKKIFFFEKFSGNFF